MPPAYPTPDSLSTVCTPSCTGPSTPDQVDTRHDPGVPSKRQQVELKANTLCYPKSRYLGWQHPLAPVTEKQAINELGTVWNDQDHSQDQYNIWKLEEFAIYRRETDYRHAGELCCLHHLKTETGINELLVDGVLIVGDHRRLVRGAVFDCMTVEGYGDDEDLVTVCIQTALGKKANVWFELGDPAPEYVRYHQPFIWVARFAKYFVDFLTEAVDPVTLKTFRKNFYPSVVSRYASSGHFQAWLSQYGPSDFGQALCANVGYLWKECYSLDTSFLRHPLWEAVDPQRLKAIPLENSAHNQTVVSPLVHQSFRNMPFASQLKVVRETDHSISKKRHDRRTQLRLTPMDCLPTRAPMLRIDTDIVKQGDVVCVQANTNSCWKASKNTRWYAYVQRIRSTKSGRQKFDVIWLYEPSDTTLGYGYYPYKNELFISDNCTCGADAIDPEAVISRVDVKWFASDPEAQESFFVRLKYRTEHTFGAYDFVSLQTSDFRCNCNDSQSEMDRVMHEFKVGDTVLVNRDHGETLEPAEVLSFSSASITLRKFLRCHRDLGDAQARPNQVQATDDTFLVGPDAISRRCKIASFSSVKDVELPYHHNGAGDLWFVISSVAASWNESGKGLPTNIPLQGMGLFCGGGSFDRGLEEGGGVTFKYGIDWAKHALHTYRANVEDPDQIQLFLGSVNDYLAKAIQGSNDKRIATIGDVDLIAAGSPCPGFSVLQRNKQSERSLRNCSLVASVCAYVDHYMPKYLILENVPGMASNPPHAKEQNVFSQTLCFLVSLGYQAQQFLMDPGHHGSCQSRVRIFIVAAAPGLTPLMAPPKTHACPELEKYGRSIGKSSNGLPFGQRKHDVSPFRFLSAKEAFKDLPDIADGHVQSCIKFPDHRPSKDLDSNQRAMISSIPRWPYGQGFMQAFNAGRLSKRAIESHSWQNKVSSAATSKAWSRIFPDRLVGCVITIIQPHCAFNGRAVHYDQHRVLSVQEARRIQAISDHEVIIGTPFQQWKIIGNGVDRKVAFALGVQLAEAWQKSVKTQNAEASTAPTLVLHTRSKEIISAKSQETSTVSWANSHTKTRQMEVITIDDDDDDDDDILDSPVSSESTPRPQTIRRLKRSLQEMFSDAKDKRSIDAGAQSRFDFRDSSLEPNEEDMEDVVYMGTVVRNLVEDTTARRISVSAKGKLMAPSNHGEQWKRARMVLH